MKPLCSPTAHVTIGPGIVIDHHLDRLVAQLRRTIAGSGYTHAEVQARLGLGKNNIDRLLNRRKTIRIEQVLQILDAIGADPGRFWLAVYERC